MTEPSITELIEKLNESKDKLVEYESKIKLLEDSIKEKDDSISNKDNEISKLQKILANNLVASTEASENKDSVKSFSDAYKEAIIENMKR